MKIPFNNEGQMKTFLDEGEQKALSLADLPERTAKQSS